MANSNSPTFLAAPHTKSFVGGMPIALLSDKILHHGNVSFGGSDAFCLKWMSILSIIYSIGQRRPFYNHGLFATLPIYTGLFTMCQWKYRPFNTRLFSSMADPTTCFCLHFRSGGAWRQPRGLLFVVFLCFLFSIRLTQMSPSKSHLNCLLGWEVFFAATCTFFATSLRRDQNLLWKSGRFIIFCSLSYRFQKRHRVRVLFIWKIPAGISIFNIYFSST